MNDFSSIFNEVSLLLQKGKAKEIVSMVEKALSDGVAPVDILEKGLISGMNVIGEKFKNGEVFVPEVLIAARAMNHASAILKPKLEDAGFNL
jgi:5-methyltetrahydrofolate--homocysteine methyltransferase